MSLKTSSESVTLSIVPRANYALISVDFTVPVSSVSIHFYCQLYVVWCMFTLDSDNFWTISPSGIQFVPRTTLTFLSSFFLSFLCSQTCTDSRRPSVLPPCAGGRPKAIQPGNGEIQQQRSCQSGWAAVHETGGRLTNTPLEQELQKTHQCSPQKFSFSDQREGS